VNRAGKQGVAWQFAQQLGEGGHAGRALQPACRPQTRGELQVSAIMVGTHLRARTRAHTVGARVMSDASS